MRTYGNDVVQARTLSQTCQDSLTIVYQDLGEYGFIGLVGACLAGLSVILLHTVGGIFTQALIAPAVIACAAVTMITATEAFRRVVENQAPDAGHAFMDVAPKLDALIRPFLPLCVLLYAVALTAGFAGDRVDGLIWQMAGLALAVFAVSYALPRSLMPAVLLTQRATSREAEAASSALVWRAPRKFALAWMIPLALPLIAFFVALDAGFGAVSSGIAAVLFVGAMPLGAVSMMLLYYDALTSLGHIRRSTAPQVEAPGLVAKRAAEAAASRRRVGL